MIGKISRVPLREVWKHEALDFTHWLVDNFDVLNDVLDMNLSNPEREQSAGSFNVDIVAEDESGDPVVIENQLEKSDHNHLGKIITYLVAIGAKTAIWIVADPRPEHVSSINWLNESSSADFYLLKIDAIKIGESPPAPLITVIVGPSAESKEVGKAKQEMAERYFVREKFWADLLEHSKTKTKLHSTISPSKHNAIGTGSGTYGLSYNYVVRKDSADVELYIDKGKDCEELNKNIFNQLYEHKDDIESKFGEPLEWQKLEGKRACRIRKQIKIGGYRDEEKWSEIHEAMVDSMIRLEDSMKPYIRKLKF